MKVRMKQDHTHAGMFFRKNQEYDVGPELGRMLVKLGLAEEVGPGEVEEAGSER